MVFCGVRLAKEFLMLCSLKTGCGICLAMSLLAGITSVARAQVPESGETTSVGVRIVRLSAVRGKVELDRGTGRGFEAGFTNLPIVQGNRLRTQGLGWAEVEFEDGGSLRITPDTQIDFSTLSRDPDGQLRNALSLKQGTLYVSRMKGDKTDLVVIADGRKMMLPPASHVRLDLYPAGSELVVVKGSVRVEDENGAETMVDRSHALKFGGSEGTQLVPAKKEAPGLYDRWDAQAVSYHNALAGSSGYGSGNLYGVRDMQYYGDFADLDGCGRVWRPYLATAGFDPAASGVWAWYPGVGYTFVSPYAWGWTSFNSGSWVSCGSRGWGWRSGAWVGMKNHGIVEPIKGPGHHRGPLEAPAPGKPTFVNAGEHELVRSRVTVGGPSQFAKDSAGLGIPRGSIGNLKQISRSVASDKPAPQPNYNGDPVAMDPFALTMLAERAQVGLRPGGGAGGRGMMELGRSAGRPVAVSLVAGGHGGGGYAGGNLSFAGAAANSGGHGGSSSGTTGVGSATSTSISAGTGSAASSSMGSRGGGSSGGAHH